MFQFSWIMFFVLMLLVSAVWLAPKVLYELLECYYIGKLKRWLERYNSGHPPKNIESSPVFLFAAGFAGGHPIKKLFPAESQNTVCAIAALLVDERLPESSIEEKRAYFKKQVAHKNLISQWFWSQR